jgi:hypothetical protein
MPDTRGRLTADVNLAFRQELLGAILTSSSSNTLYTADGAFRDVVIILTTASGITTSQTAIVYHRPAGATKADSQIIFNGAVNAGENIVLPAIGLEDTDVLTVDVSATSKIVASARGVAI